MSDLGEQWHKAKSDGSYEAMREAGNKMLDVLTAIERRLNGRSYSLGNDVADLLKEVAPDERDWTPSTTDVKMTSSDLPLRNSPDEVRRIVEYLHDHDDLEGENK